mmetsp:Transcript_57813/g.146747  ORF Transcript_57813/g.146747 Transcript_57813/m.146747 type:complete len:497 (-) Transcript_57813:107-1597(-)
MALRVLALHGFGQSASVFMEKRVKEITRKLRDILALHALDAPHTLPYDPSLRGWWVYPPELWNGRGETIQALAEELLKVPDFEPLGFRESFEAVLAEWSRGGYDGILGFSQGAILAAAVCCELHRRGAPAPRFALLISGFGRPLPRGVEAYPPQAPLPMPSLHIWGLADDHIPGWASETLAGYFENPRVYTHSGGHFVPQKAADVDAIKDFLVPFVKEGGVSSSTSAAAAAPAKPRPPQPKPRPGPPQRQEPPEPKVDDVVAPSGAQALDQASTACISDELGGALRYYARAPPAAAPARASVAALSTAMLASESPRTPPEGIADYIEAEQEAPGPGTFERMLALLRRESIDFSLLGPHPACRTSEDSVRVRLEGGWEGVSLHSGAKAMLLRAPGTEERWILTVLPADKKLSWRKVRALKGKATRMATEEEVVRVAGCLSGAVPPFAAAFPAPVECLLDEQMPQTMTFNCGLRTRSIRMSRADYERVQSPEVVDIAE